MQSELNSAVASSPLNEASTESNATLPARVDTLSRILGATNRQVAKLKNLEFGVLEAFPEYSFCRLAIY